MPDAKRGFADSNILLYAISDDTEKKPKALKLLKTHPVISLQVIHECSNVLRRKQKQSFVDIQKILDSFLILTELVIPDLNTVRHAWRIGTRYGYNYFDCVIIASAIDAGCTVLYSEDMHNHHLVSGNLQIVNPFIT